MIICSLWCHFFFPMLHYSNAMQDMIENKCSFYCTKIFHYSMQELFPQSITCPGSSIIQHICVCKREGEIVEHSIRGNDNLDVTKIL